MNPIARRELVRRLHDLAQDADRKGDELTAFELRNLIARLRVRGEK